MAEITNIRCADCGTTTQFEWYKGIDYVCSNCKRSINFLDAIFDGRVKTTNGFVESKPKRKKR